MSPERQLEIVKKHYFLNSSGDYTAAEELLTEDFSITIPSPFPFAGVYRGKRAFRELIPIVVQSIAPSIATVATTVGGDYAVVLVEFTLPGDDGPPALVAEAIKFRGDQICEIRPYYHDTTPLLAAAARRKSAASRDE